MVFLLPSKQPLVEQPTPTMSGIPSNNPDPGPNNKENTSSTFLSISPVGRVDLKGKKRHFLLQKVTILGATLMVRNLFLIIFIIRFSVISPIDLSSTLESSEIIKDTALLQADVLIKGDFFLKALLIKLSLMSNPGRM